MSVSYTYTTLRSNLINTTEDQGTEFAAALDNIIALGETLLLRDLDLELFDSVTTGSFSNGNPIITKPANFVALRTLHYSTASGLAPIEMKSWEFIKDYWPLSSTTTTTPKYAADYSPTEWYVAGTPGATPTSWTARYIVRPTGLSAGNPTTWLSTVVGDLLFYACLVSSEQFLKADDRIPVWKAEYQNRLSSARMELRRDKRDDYAPLSGTPDASAQ